MDTWSIVAETRLTRITSVKELYFAKEKQFEGIIFVSVGSSHLNALIDKNSSTKYGHCDPSRPRISVRDEGDG